jgi:hypothetical protein
MSQYEYKVVPAPVKGLKARGIKTAESRFANALQDIMNRMGSDGWEYQRAETLPSQERSGFTGSVTTYRNVLVFRRPRAGDISVFQPILLDIADDQDDMPVMAAPVIETPRTVTPEPETTSSDRPAGQPGATKMLRDNGVEELSEVSGMTEALKKRASQKSK